MYNKFFNHRTHPLWNRFGGLYRAYVVETNDPLRMHRIRFVCPDLHDYTLKDHPEQCQWAVPCFDLGTKRQGRWAHPRIGDWVWITFERNHPNAPIWVGFANPTRRKFYAYPSIYGPTPVPVNDTGKKQSAPEDYNIGYMPQDERPMSHGWQDRYGNLDICSSVGFFPKEHDKDAAPAGHDAVQDGDYNASENPPKINEPDVKHMTKITKYGNIITLGDQGYYWQNEFKGDFDKDEKFETDRWLYLQRLLNEDHPDTVNNNAAAEDSDQRRIELKTRYGSKIEMRDVGWAQAGPIESSCRKDEYGTSTNLSLEETNDFRWLKLRTKAGMLFQMYDKGADPSEDLFIKRPLIEECAQLTEKEKDWQNKDARWIRIVTRYGYKIVLDDRGSDPIDAEGKEDPRGNGILIKGRRTPKANNQKATGDPRGFYLEFNENDELNHLTIGSPLGHTIELNDRYEYLMLSSSQGKEYSTKWQKLKENEFLLTPTVADSMELNSHHLKLDHENEYIRLKSRSGNGPRPDHVVNPPEAIGWNQGVEIHDGSNGDGAWVEMVDCDGRGMWFSHRNKLTAWRARDDGFMYQFMDENQKVIATVNGKTNDQSTAIKLVCSGNIELYALNEVNILASHDINLVSTGGNINLQAGSTMLTVSGYSPQVFSNAKYMNWASNADYATQAGSANVAAGLGGGGAHPAPILGGFPANRATPPNLPKLKPDDRGSVYNYPFETADSSVVEHPLP